MRTTEKLPLGFVVLAVALGLLLCSCGGSSKSTPSAPVPIAVSVSASSTTVDGSNSVTLSASVSNDLKAAGVSWSLSGVGALSGQNAISATYTAPAAVASAASATVTATSITDPSKSSALTITIPAKLALITTSLPPGNVGTSYSAQLKASNGISPYTWTLSNGDLPSCMALSPTGLLASSSALVASCAGTFAISFKVTDSGKPTGLTDSASVNLVVNAAPPITFTGTMPPSITVGNVYSGSAAASGGVGALTYSILDGSLPPGLVLHTSSGTINGSASSDGTFDFTVNAADGYGDSSTHLYRIVVAPQSPLALDAKNLPTSGTINSVYSGTITASGGSGSYSFQVTGLPSDNLGASPNGTTLTISGTPASAATVNFTVKLTDTATSAFITQSYTIIINSTTLLSLPAPNPSSLPDATVGQGYFGAITVSGGVAPYSWTIGGLPVTESGLPLTNGLAAYSSGGTTIGIRGAPFTPDPVVLSNVSVTDSTHANAMQTYTIAVHGVPGVTGHVYTVNSCADHPTPLPPVTVTINTTPQQQTTLDANGDFSFANIPDGTWTVTPSLMPPPAGPSSVIYPASADVTVSNGASMALQFSVQLGYTVSGTVSYSGNTTGRIYLNLINTYCLNGGVGTSLPAPGDFVIRGVPPGSYTLQAWMDPSMLGNQAPNLADPTGSSSSFSVTTADQTGVIVNLSDPTLGAQTTGPTIKSISPHNAGVAIGFAGNSVTDRSGREVFSSYTVQWSSNSSFSNPSTAVMKAVGTNKADGRNWSISSSKNLWILANGNNGMNGSFTSGKAYFFRVQGSNAGGNSNWVYWAGPAINCSASTCAVAVTIGEPSDNAYAAVSGRVSVTSEMSPDAPGPLYVGYYDKNSNSAYLQVIANPVIYPLVNYFTVSVPKSATTSYVPFGMLDQNKDGLIDANDVTNISDAPDPITINGDMTAQLVELPYVYLDPLVPVRFIQNHFLNDARLISSSTYYLEFSVLPVNRMAVAVQLVYAPNVLTPMDLGSYCQGCPQFFNAIHLGAAVPSLTDPYVYHVTYSDGTEDDVFAQPFSWNSTGRLIGPDNVVSNPMPLGNVSGQTQPTFSWAYPADTSGVRYTFDLCCGNNGSIWEIPKHGSDSLGFTASQIPGTLVWGADPTDSANSPIPSLLTPRDMYFWEITALDNLGNSATIQAAFTP